MIRRKRLSVSHASMEIPTTTEVSRLRGSVEKQYITVINVNI